MDISILLTRLRNIPINDEINDHILVLEQQATTDDDALCEALTSLRQYLHGVLDNIGSTEQQDNQQIGSLITSVIDPIHIALIEITKLTPINTNDFSSHEEIATINKIYTASGYVFDIRSLIEYHHARFYRGSTARETDQEKFLLNPYTNLAFHYKDALHIMNEIKVKGLTITGVRLSQQGPIIDINPPSATAIRQQVPEIDLLPAPMRQVANTISVTNQPVRANTNNFMLTRENNLAQAPGLEHLYLAPNEIIAVLNMRQERARLLLSNANHSLQYLSV